MDCLSVNPGQSTGWHLTLCVLGCRARSSVHRAQDDSGVSYRDIKPSTLRPNTVYLHRRSTRVRILFPGVVLPLGPLGLTDMLHLVIEAPGPSDRLRLSVNVPASTEQKSWTRIGVSQPQVGRGKPTAADIDIYEGWTTQSKDDDKGKDNKPLSECLWRLVTIGIPWTILKSHSGTQQEHYIVVCSVSLSKLRIYVYIKWTFPHIVRDNGMTDSIRRRDGDLILYEGLQSSQNRTNILSKAKKTNQCYFVSRWSFRFRTCYIGRPGVKPGLGRSWNSEMCWFPFVSRVICLYDTYRTSWL